jgi:3-oxoadipate enol-lactonase
MTTSSTRSLLVPTVLGRIYVHDAGPVAGPTALLWPSLFTDGQTSWGAQLSELHDLGWRTLLVDPPGTGRTAAAPRVFTMEECAEAAIDILDAAGVAKAAMVGLSWGGYVGLRVALAAPDRVSALVLSNTGARSVPFALRMRNRLLATLIQIRAIPGGPSRLIVPGLISKHSRRENPALAAGLAATIDHLDPVGLARAVRSVVVEPTSVVHLLDRITAPTLVITGAEDRGLPPLYSTELADRITGARLQVLPRVGHLSPREAPATVGTMISDFLRANWPTMTPPPRPKGSQPQHD